MSKEDYFQDLLVYWQEKAYESLDSAEDEMKAGRFSFSVNRLYYAMFPLEFAFEVVNTYSQEGDCIIDPFAGRCSSVYAGAVLGRNSWGIEINPVGWLYGFDGIHFSLSTRKAWRRFIQPDAPDKVNGRHLFCQLVEKTRFIDSARNSSL